MCVYAEEERAGDLLPLSIQTNGLSDGEDVPLVKSVFECRAAMAGGSKRYSLRGHRVVGNSCVVCGDKLRNVNQPP